VQRVAQLGGATDADSVALSPTKGVHLVLPRLTRQHGLFFEGRRDGRMMFVIPWLDDCTLLGTTDTDFPGDPTHIHADPVDVAYLLREINELLPHRAIVKKDILTTFSGVRPLLRAPQDNPSDRPREHRIARHGENLLSVAGGKYTTYRAVADQVVERVYRVLGKRAPRCLTADTPLPDHRPPQHGGKITHSPAIFESDITYACREEMAMSVSDVMRRRTPLALSRLGETPTAERVAQMMSPILGWTEDQTRNSLQMYITEREQNHPT
jgi:glycerol-3-phosphate dehydrogenase